MQNMHIYIYKGGYTLVPICSAKIALITGQPKVRLQPPCIYA